MREPDPSAMKSPLAGPTVDYRPTEATADLPRSKLVLASTPGSAGAGEVQTLLRKRLTFGALLFAAIYGFLLVTFLPVLVRDEGITARALLGITLACIIVVVAGGLAGVLLSTRPLSLFALRVGELVLFVPVTVQLALRGYFKLWDSDIPDLVLRLQEGSKARLAEALLNDLASDLTFTSIFLIVSYGVLIPNTWRRCSVVVAGMAAFPVALWTAAGLGGVLPPGLWLPLLGSNLGLSLAIAAALAIYGSHRIEVLRQEAYEARKLGQYRLKQRLGAGGMGEVYLAEHVLLRRPCAVKLIRPQHTNNPINLHRFEREVQATATLTNWHTVEIFDYGHTADGTFYYVMEYLPGPNLEQLVAKVGPLPPKRTIHFLRQVCEALREAHGIGLIHRDIKPSNIITCERGGLYDVAKLLDFGLVLGYDQGEASPKLTQEGAIAGSPAYMSPEQAAGKPGLDARSDIYSLGAVAYFLLTGQPPFVRETGMQTLAAHLCEPVVAPANLRTDVPVDLQKVVLRCLEKAPASRFPDAESLDQALARCLSTFV